MNLKDIKKSYAAIKKLAFKEYAHGNYQRSLEFIDNATVLAQQFNWIYSDPEVEELLQNISKNLFKINQSKYKPSTNRVVIFDDYCTSYVLALQYIKALVHSSKEILYITGKDLASTKYNNILNTIKEYPNVSIELIPQSKDRIKRVKDIWNAIVNFQPSKLFLHLTAKSICIPALYSLPEKIDRYIINLADQTFWLGSKGIDYSLEFRDFGATVSLEKRGLKEEQLIWQPFYPIVDNNPFQGFPEGIEDKVIIFSGGDFYKTIDPSDTFWNLVKSILNKNSDAVFLLATKADNINSKQYIENFVIENKFEKRFFYIGFRPDINEVFKHCDIFMGTCPASGSLMSQLAAFNDKPILQFYLPNTNDDETEAAICHNNIFPISYTEKDKFLDEAKLLIEDKNYRVKKGEQLQKAMFTEHQFNSQFSKILEGKINQTSINNVKIDYNSLTQRWYWIEQMKFINTLDYIVSIFHIRQLFSYLPKIGIIYYFNRFVKNKLLKISWYRYKLDKFK